MQQWIRGWRKKNKEAAGKEEHEENEKKQCIIRKPEAAYDDPVCSLSAAFGGHSPGGLVLAGGSSGSGFFQKNLAPCLQYPFGTDWMGRDMFVRTIAGLSLSIRLGAVTAGISSLIALALGLGAAVLGKAADSVIGGLIDLVLGIPHILLLVLISYGAGKGFRGVIIGISLTHWTSLARLLRAEALQVGFQPVCTDCPQAGKGTLVSGWKAFDAPPDSTDAGGNGTFISSRYSSRSQHYLSGLWSSSGAAGNRRDSLGKHEISVYGTLVAGAVSGAFACGSGSDVSSSGAGSIWSAGSGTGAEVTE